MIATDYVLVGTGLAPLVAARILLEEGKSVLVLNPDTDFFREDSELPFDPLRELRPQSRGEVSLASLSSATFNQAIQTLRPHFPGSLEEVEWQNEKKKDRVYQDSFAPFVRSRQWLWLANRLSPHRSADLEKLYVDAADRGAKPLHLEGLLAMGKCPGFSLNRSPELLERSEDVSGVLIPGLSDFDVARYRRGLLEFIREKLGSERLISNAHIHWTDDHFQFSAHGRRDQVQPRNGFLVFWTPKLHFWLQQAAKSQKHIRLPAVPNTRVWEHWSLVCRDPVDPRFVGVTKNLTLWSGGEGDLSKKPVCRLTVLAMKSGMDGASDESFSDILDTCREVLGWESLKVRSLRLRTLFDWESDSSPEPFLLAQKPFAQWLVKGSDGPGFRVVEAAAQAARKALEGA